MKKNQTIWYLSGGTPALLHKQSGLLYTIMQYFIYVPRPKTNSIIMFPGKTVSSLTWGRWCMTAKRVIKGLGCLDIKGLGQGLALGIMFRVLV